MKGICLIWSRGRHFSPSLPGDRYLNLGSKSDHRAEISGNIVRYDALAPRPEVLRSFLSLYANNVFWVLFPAQVQVFKNQFIFHLRAIEKLQFSLIFKIVLFFVYFLGFFFCFVFGERFFCIDKMVLEILNTHIAKISVVSCLFLADPPQNRPFFLPFCLL